MSILPLKHNNSVFSFSLKRDFNCRVCFSLISDWVQGLEGAEELVSLDLERSGSHFWNFQALNSTWASSFEALWLTLGGGSREVESGWELYWWLVLSSEGIHSPHRRNNKCLWREWMNHWSAFLIFYCISPMQWIHKTYIEDISICAMNFFQISFLRPKNSNGRSAFPLS